MAMHEKHHHNFPPDAAISQRIRQARANMASSPTGSDAAGQTARRSGETNPEALLQRSASQISVGVDDPLKPWSGSHPPHEEPPAPDTAAGWGDWPLWASWRPSNPHLLAQVEAAGLNTLKKPYRREFVQVNEAGDMMNTLRMGSGPPLVLIHGMGGGIVFWAANLDELAEHFTVYAIDFMGWGRSSRPELSEAVKTDPKAATAWGVDALEGWRKAIGIDKMVLGGHSMGGFFAMEYALKYHEHISNLIIMDSWGMPRHEDVEWNQPLIIRKALPIVSKAPLLTAVRALGPVAPTMVGIFRADYRRKFAATLGNNNIIRDYIYHCAAQTPTGEVVFKTLCTERYFAKVPMSNRIRHELPDAAKKIPISFLYGKNTWMNPEVAHKEAMALKERGFEVRMYGLDKSGHHLYVEQYMAFNEVVAAIGTHDWDTAEKYAWVPPEKPKEHSLNPFKQ